MASVVISGDTSGSVTLSAPAVSGSTTLTLPATSGTVLTSAGGTITGTTTFSGGVANAYGFGVGTAVPSSGAGIAFPATQSASSDANTLDDYEEGAWTPAYGSAFTGTYASNGQVGFYTKVGRLVTAYFWVQVSTVSGSGNLSIQGFPFASISSVNYSAGTVIHLASSWGTNTPFSIDGSGTSYNIKYRASSNGSIDTGNIAVSDLATNAFMRATLIYFTA
jgi:hypothetical protein